MRRHQLYQYCNTVYPFEVLTIVTRNSILHVTRQSWLKIDLSLRFALRDSQRNGTNSKYYIDKEFICISLQSTMVQGHWIKTAEMEGEGDIFQRPLTY